MARETGLEPATSGVTGQRKPKQIERDPKTLINKSRAISVGAFAGFGAGCVNQTYADLHGVDQVDGVAPRPVDPKQRGSG